MIDEFDNGRVGSHSVFMISYLIYDYNNMDQGRGFAFTTPLTSAYSSPTGRYLDTQRTLRLKAIEGDEVSHMTFSTQRISVQISHQYRDKIRAILGNLPVNDDLRDSIHAKRFAPVYGQVRMFIKPGKARMLLYGPKGCGKMTLILQACAASRSFPYILSINAIRDQATQAAIGFMLALDDKYPPTLILTDCGLMKEDHFTLLAALPSRNTTMNIVGIASSLPKDITTIKTFFMDRFMVQQDDSYTKDILSELDGANGIFQQPYDKFSVAVNRLCTGLTIGTIVSIYKSAISNTMDTISTIPVYQTRNTQDSAVAIIFDCAANFSASTNTIEAIEHVLPNGFDVKTKECFVLAFIQGLLKASVYSRQGYEVYE